MSKKLNLQNIGVYITLAVLVVLFSVLSSSFLTVGNMINLFRQIAINGLIAIGMTMVITTGGIDLSVGSILGLTAMVSAYLMVSGVPAIVAIIICLALGALLGLVNGFIIAQYKLQAFIVTLATMTTFRGLTYVISDGKPISNISTSSAFTFIGKGDILGIPIPIFIFFIAFAIAYVVLNKTVFGRNVYATGGNETAAKLSGVDTKRTHMKVYVISGFLAALAGLILISRLNSAQPTLGDGYELDAVAAVVIGGTSLAGGRGRISGTLIGILILGVISNGLNIIGVSSFYQEIVKGLIILIAVFLDRKNN